MKYEEEILSYLKNTFGNLDGEYSNETHNQSTLFWNALELSKSSNPNERVLAIVLYHQSSIEMMKQLIIYSNFLIKLLVYPHKINHRKIKEEDGYSTIINFLEYHISFQQKGSFLSDIRKLNKFRTKVSHDMFKYDYEVFSIDEVNEMNKLFEAVFDKFQIGILDLGDKIKKAKKRSELIELIERYEQNK